MPAMTSGNIHSRWPMKECSLQCVFIIVCIFLIQSRGAKALNAMPSSKPSRPMAEPHHENAMLNAHAHQYSYSYVFSFVMNGLLQIFSRICLLLFSMFVSFAMFVIIISVGVHVVGDLVRDRGRRFVIDAVCIVFVFSCAYVFVSSRWGCHCSRCSSCCSWCCNSWCSSRARVNLE